MKCLEQIHVKLKTPIWNEFNQSFVESVPIPCGKCAACIHRKIAEWTFRLEQERISSACCYFVTLTYDTMHVPINKYGRMTLDKKDLELFFKRLRQNQKRNSKHNAWEDHVYKTELSKESIKYYAVGEYGSKRKRPHYHAIIYNASKEAIRASWELGEIDIQIPRSRAALSYVVKYLQKRLFKITPGNVEREFSVMSKGIGMNYVDKHKAYHKKYYWNMYTGDESAFKIPMSKFYRDKIFTDAEKRMQIPEIKKSIEYEEEKAIQKMGEENYRAWAESKRKGFVTKCRRAVKPRNDAEGKT